ncbi:MAG: hypothetical protein PF487_01150 [Bacteroidales bacterium]|jgi:hypothetical protein|nr:hypothetical protein [Bacteroidales bacterium]
MKPNFVTECPICGHRDCKKDSDFPETMENCNHCGAEWNIDGELLLDSRIGLSIEEVVLRGWSIIDYQESL